MEPWDFAERLASAYVAYVRKQAPEPNFLVAWDREISSPMIAAAIVRGLRRAGANVLRAGACPAPFFPLRIRQLGLLDAGILVLGSEKPAEWKEIKLFLGEKELGEGAREEVSVLMEAPAQTSATMGKVSDLSPVLSKSPYC